MGLLLVAAGFTAFLWVTKLIATLFLKCCVSYLDDDLVKLLENSAALNNFVIFAAFSLACVSLLCSFLHISKHVIISMDIICILTSLILTRLHRLNDSSCPA